MFSRTTSPVTLVGLGYAFMSLATLCAAPAFTGGRLERWVRWLFLGNAALLIPTVLTYFVSREFMLLVSPWAITVPGSTLLIAVRFWRAARSGAEAAGRTPWKVAAVQ